MKTYTEKFTKLACMTHSELLECVEEAFDFYCEILLLDTIETRHEEIPFDITEIYPDLKEMKERARNILRRCQIL